MAGDRLFWVPHVCENAPNLCLRPLNAVHVAGDRLFWEPHIRLGTADHNLATLARLLPWLKLKRA